MTWLFIGLCNFYIIALKRYRLIIPYREEDGRLVMNPMFVKSVYIILFPLSDALVFDRLRTDIAWRVAN